MYEQMLKGDAAYSLHYQMADIVIMLLMQMTKKAKDHWAQCLQQICWVYYYRFLRKKRPTSGKGILNFEPPCILDTLNPPGKIDLLIQVADDEENMCWVIVSDT